MVIFKFSFYWFCANTLENKCYGILLKRRSHVLDIPDCEVIYYVIVPITSEKPLAPFSFRPAQLYIPEEICY